MIDRLGIPLLEVTTKPQLNEPIQVKQAARALGRLLRACRVKKDLGQYGKMLTYLSMMEIELN